MKRFSIWGTERGSDHEVELAQVDSNPQAILDGYSEVMLKTSNSAFKGGKKTKIRKFTWLRIVENAGP